MNKILEIFKSLDKKIKEIMKYGIIYCLWLALIASCFLITYELFYSSPAIYYIGIYLLKDSILFACAFLSFGVGFDKIKKELI